MMKYIFRYTIIFLLLAFRCVTSPAQMVELTGIEGQKYQRNYPMVSGTTTFVNLPLPEGELTVIRGDEYTVGMTQKKMREIFLVTVKDVNKGNDVKDLVNFIYVKASISSSSFDWSDQPCKGEDWIYINEYDSSVLGQRCMTIRQSMFLNRSDNKVHQLTRSYFDKNNISFVNGGLTLSVTIFNRSGKFWLMNFVVFPTLYGLEKPTEGMDSPWHLKKYKSDPEKVLFIDKLKVWAEAYSDIIFNNFKNEKQSTVYLPEFVFVSAKNSKTISAAVNSNAVVATNSTVPTTTVGANNTGAEVELKAKAEAQEKAIKEAELKAKAEAQEKAKAESAQAQAAKDQAKWEALEKDRKDGEIKANAQADELAKIQADSAAIKRKKESSWSQVLQNIQKYIKENDDKGTDIFSKGATKYKFNTEKDKMTGVEIQSASTEGKIGNGTYQVDVTCKNGSLHAEITILKAELPVAPTGRIRVNEKTTLFKFNVSEKWNNVINIPLNRSINNNRLSELSYWYYTKEGVWTQLVQGLMIGDLRVLDFPNTLGPTRVKDIVSELNALVEVGQRKITLRRGYGTITYDFALEIPTSYGNFFFEISPYDPNIRRLIGSCKGLSKPPYTAVGTGTGLSEKLYMFEQVYE